MTPTLSTHLIETRWPDATVVADLELLRSRAPLTHCLTNYVAAPLTANILLAIGAVPAMVSAVEEVGIFAPVADGILLNVGTVTTENVNVFLRAGEAAHRSGKRWVLDPVAVGAGLRLRDRVAADLLEFKPAVIRGNGSEILGISGAAGGGKGPDSTADSLDALPVAQDLARATGAVVAVSGVIDYVTDGERVVAIPGGHVLMTKVTGVGCSLGGIIAAFVGVVDDPLQAAVSASAVLAEAGSRAALTATGTGSFAVGLLDHLSTLGLA